ncbi:hypothetical protein C9374_000430 [Naegleria lovaniensis]|uniref:Uncharacterized protein n=1 Tax=Naegleria lovaniensis TaxID=51637 RepID=A0AA88GYC9_NAELO|nr:uncharacterized protein C9374_000430 [Naegleria lovaniensis]KAG2388266.1 hypothetical protein C9374_000430 [Naegleria lovaniensis]
MFQSYPQLAGEKKESSLIKPSSMDVAMTSICIDLELRDADSALGLRWSPLNSLHSHWFQRSQELVQHSSESYYSSFQTQQFIKQQPIQLLTNMTQQLWDEFFVSYSWLPHAFVGPEHASLVDDIHESPLTSEFLEGCLDHGFGFSQSSIASSTEQVTSLNVQPPTLNNDESKGDRTYTGTQVATRKSTSAAWMTSYHPPMKFTYYFDHNNSFLTPTYSVKQNSSVCLNNHPHPKKLVFVKDHGQKAKISKKKRKNSNQIASSLNSIATGNTAKKKNSKGPVFELGHNMFEEMRKEGQLLSKANPSDRMHVLESRALIEEYF